MTHATSCEHCGRVILPGEGETVVVETWVHHFCSERCKIQWGEMAELEDEEE